MQPERRLYREHKYVTLVMNELDHKIGKADFRDPKQLEELTRELAAVINMLSFHAKHEDENIHALLKKHKSDVFKETEADHHNHEVIFNTFKEQLANIAEAQFEQEKIAKGYQFYLSYRKFIAENLEHLHREETLLMPELKRLCSKEELESIDFPVYQQMTSEHLVGMLETLFPVFNPDDKEYFICDLIEAVPSKFIESWPSIAVLLTETELADLAKRVELIKQLLESEKVLIAE